MTSYGIKLRLPVFTASGITVAVLLCEDAENHQLGLLLFSEPPRSDPTRPRYYAGCIYRQCQVSHYAARLVRLGEDLNKLQFDGKRVKATWRTIYIVPSPPDGRSPSATTAQLTINSDLRHPFRLPHWLVSRLLAMGFRVSQFELDSQAGRATRIKVYKAIGGEAIYLDLGICHHDTTARWSKVTMCSEADFKQSEEVTFAHSCSEHHIDAWNDRSKVFPDSQLDVDRSVRLSFTPCKASLGNPRLVVHIELLGRVYQEMLREVNMTNAFSALE